MQDTEMPNKFLLAGDYQPAKKRRIEFAPDVVEIPIATISALGSVEGSTFGQDMLEECVAALQKLVKGKQTMTRDVSGLVYFWRGVCAD
jgi:hypothetical protein